MVPGTAILCPRPGKELLALVGWGTRQAPRTPPAGFQRAPCGCFFDPWVFHIRWASTTLPAPAAAQHNHGPGDLAGDLLLPKEVTLEDACRLFGCSPDAAWDGASSSPEPEDAHVTSAAIPTRDFASLSLPAELLTPNYSVPEILDTILSPEEFYSSGMELWWDVGVELPLPQPAR
ncbi:PREDICTED: proline-rich protein 22, partial [Buceros rhinoceros silvestris]|uniref:proline-rich protein 22 n=1 Tax=Buceros rhinoceros silvestris TaxID=175836 RepID=UPI000528CA5B